MRHSTAESTTRRRILVAAASLMLLVVGIGTYVVLSSRSSTPAVAHATDVRGAGAADHAPPETALGPLVPLPRIDEPEKFSLSVAHALFDWDTSRSLKDYTGRLLAAADPTGQESPGLVADIANYQPTPSAWLDLRPYATQQRIEIDSIEVPPRWAVAVADAGPNGLLPGTVAYTIEGTRQRTGQWEGKTVTTEHAVAFTMFVVCRPSYPRCYLLRLSRLDEPLE